MVSMAKVKVIERGDNIRTMIRAPGSLKEASCWRASIKSTRLCQQRWIRGVVSTSRVCCAVKVKGKRS